MRKIWLFLLITVMVVSMIFAFSCKEAATAEEDAAAEEDVTGEDSSEEEGTVVAEEEEVYYWGTELSSYSLFQNHDIPAFHYKGWELGVTTEVFGPEDTDIAKYITAIQQVAAQPGTKGIIMLDWGPEMRPIVNETVANGIPIVLVDSDDPESDRLAFVGTNWYKLGQIQAQYMADNFPEGADQTGTIVMIGITNMNIMQQGFQGFTDYLNTNVPGVKVLPAIDSGASVEETAQKIGDFINSEKDLVGVACFDSTTGPGAGIAIKEAEKVGDIVLTMVDIEEQHLSLIKDGTAVVGVGQKREFFTYYGLQMVYDAVHSKAQFTNDDGAANITNIPALIETGFIIADATNIDLMLESVGRDVFPYDEMD